MRLQEYEKAVKIVEALKKVNKTIKKAENAYIQASGSCWGHYISEHSDGSGWSIDMSGTVPTTDVITVILGALQKRREELETELEEL
jgi:hypothetical protein